MANLVASHLVTVERRGPLPAANHRFRTALRFLLSEYVRNRTALLLLAVFVPIWYGFMAALISHGHIAFRLWATAHFLSVDGQALSLTTAGMNALTLITGFLVFSATKRGMTFDRRLALGGYPHRTLVSAKLAAMAMASLAISVYAALVLLVFWHTQITFPILILGFFAGALTYAGLGFLLGVLVRGELEGFFIVIMVSLVDTLLQNPLGNPAANKDLLAYFPSFGATQVAVAGGFTHLMPWTYFGIGLIWPAALSAIGATVFWWRTRVPNSVHITTSPPRGTAAMEPTPSA
jgi:ABC-2 type transport system permease protein